MTSKDFKLIKVQILVFTSDVMYTNHRFLSHFLNKRGLLFDGEPKTFENADFPFPLPFPLSLPRAIVKSKNDWTQFIVASDRLEFIKGIETEDQLDVISQLALAADLFSEFFELMGGKISRTGIVLSRMLRDDNPALSIARHFCQPKWTEDQKDSPREFELHSLKSYKTVGEVEINNWIRCKSENFAVSLPMLETFRGISVEQDFNTVESTPVEWQEAMIRVREIFRAAADDLDQTLETYFPS